ncbi:MAG: bifunctional diaminohydroxyphosphoribosylaminopyrimidine deaminase/5-amino-6-(5-phosphoribosylamino)uracil reductase RibD [Armatimonadetes bacterium]|nr:bifunctional diaminohydroxyphosphoribosylaminopyrimidine deaminase/5-amino-6-(5-phosphoribosylamino)uracil reductase RibD [Armatimonadota bacterium]
MERALQLALQGLGRTSPNPVVGAIVVQGDQIVGEGYHARAGEPHAEIHALERAGTAARGATLYVTLEPCCHQGRTPPCVGRVLESGVSRVVVGMTDPNPRVQGEGIRQLRQAGVEVELIEPGSRSRCAQANRFFIKHVRTGLPFVTMKYAMTLDGKIATRIGHSQWISGEEARAYVHEQRGTHDAIMVGVGTVLADDPRLTARLPGARDPLRVVVDSHARTPPGARCLPALVAVGPAAPMERVEALRACGAEVQAFSARNGRVDLTELMRCLAARDVLSVLLEGGGRLNASAIEADLVDAVAVFIAPIFIGGERAHTPLAGIGVERVSEGWTLREVQWRTMGKDILLEGYLHPVPVE